MAIKKKDQRWSVEKRLEFIDFRLFWEGQINRSDIMNQFGVSVPQASNDLSKYQEIAPKNIQYDHKQKRYFSNPSFKPAFISTDPDIFFSNLQDPLDENENDTWLSYVPDHDFVKMPKRNMKAEVLKSLTDAMKDKKSLNIQYQSMSSEKPNWRIISPHAFAFDGMRWHTRSFCHKDNIYKDFLLSRIQSVGEIADEAYPDHQDLIWETYFKLILKPHPKLTDSQARAVELDYDMTNHKLELNIRLALLYYYLRRLGLQDCDGEASNPREQHVVVSNKVETKEALEASIKAERRDND